MAIKGDITGKACQKTKTDCRANKKGTCPFPISGRVRRQGKGVFTFAHDAEASPPFTAAWLAAQSFFPMI